MLKHAVWIIILLDTITFKHRPSNLVTVQIKNKSAPTNPFCIGFLSGTRGAEQLREQKKGVREMEEVTERESEGGKVKKSSKTTNHTWDKLAHSAWGHSHSSVHLTSESSATKEPLAPSTTHPTDAPRSSFIKAQPLTLRETINLRGDDRFKRTRLRSRGCTVYLDQYHFFSTHWPKGFTRLNRKVTGNIITTLFGCILFMRSTIYS